MTAFTETDPLWTANYTAYNTKWSTDTWDTSWLANWTAYNSTAWTTTNSEIWNVVANDTFAYINEPLWTANWTAYNTTWSTDTWDTSWLANWTAYNDSWTTTNTEIWNVIANDTYVPYTDAVSN